ncbi:hypothetical protein HID58_095149 [Brassica napus]|uniref:Isopenicillin N synthase-like Fe(2+) 2OG dioxygenase domain-containing protein n=1 Tax=Brassica napus TaxID=3708 RepID=A0ABQ7X4P9_BRANA|nr:hypothetical protein HID58_095149 [Brassica napus]
MMDTRFNLYPPCPRPDKVIGVKPHADGSAFTLLLPDKDIMSNGIYKSPVHRVVTNREKERISVATFCVPGADQRFNCRCACDQDKTKIV